MKIMSGSDVIRLVKLCAVEKKEGINLEAITNRDLPINGYKIINLDLNSRFDVIFRNVTSATVDPTVIISLNLSRSSLNYLPDGLANLQLKRLDLSYNEFVNVPNCILQGLRLLEDLNLSHNALNTFDDEPKCMKKLRVLRINNNNLLNIPNWVLTVGSFNLEELYYSRNRITSWKASKFLCTASYELKKLELISCYLDPEDMDYLKSVRMLEYLDISNDESPKFDNAITNEALVLCFTKPRFADRLRILNLSNLCVALLPTVLCELTVLEELYLCKNYLMWLPDTIDLLCNLRILDLSYNQLVILPNMLEMKKLKILKVPYNHLNSLHDQLPECMEVLDLYDNNLETDDNLQFYQNLKQIDLEQNVFDTKCSSCERYEEMKLVLRLNNAEERGDGPKAVANRSKLEDSDTSPSLYESSEYSSEGDHLEAEAVLQESWASESEHELLCDGCTLSDNEWIGEEPILIGINPNKFKPIETAHLNFEDAL